MHNSHNRLSVHIQELVSHLYAAGPRPVLEALFQVARGDSVETVLRAFRRVPVATYHAIGANELPIKRRVH